MTDSLGFREKIEPEFAGRLFEKVDGLDGHPVVWPLTEEVIFASPSEVPDISEMPQQDGITGGGIVLGAADFQDAEYINIVSNGASDNRVDIWYVGDGYTLNERDQLIADVLAQFTYMITPTSNGLTSPFDRYANFFNVHVVFAASAESGADIPTEDTYVDTRFDASYSWGGGVERLLYFDTSLASQAINTVMPTSVDNDMQFGTVNATKYGGGGGSFGVYAGGNSNAYEVALHEIGHSYAGLADEYGDYDSENETTYTGAEPSQANITTDDTGSKWSQWLGYNDGVLGVIGAYEEAYYNDYGVYRPTENSKMRSLNRPFDAIAKEQFILAFYEEVDPLDDWYTPGNDGLLINPTLWGQVIDTDVISRYWYVDGVLQEGMNGEIEDLRDFGLSAGTYEITMLAIDETDMVRINLELLQQSVSWTVTITDSTIAASTSSDVIFGFETSDQIDGLAGLDTIIGGGGDDYLSGGEGGDLIFGDSSSEIDALSSSLLG